MPLLVAGGAALRRMQRVKLQLLHHSRRCHGDRILNHPRVCSSSTGSSSGIKSGLSFVSPGEVTRTPLVLFHSYGHTEAKVAVVKDVFAFDRFLESVLAGDAGGVNRVVCNLRRVLHRKRRELAPLLARKKEIDAVVERCHLPMLRCLILAFLILQFVVLFRWVFVIFDWNLVEPMTYFLGYSVVWVSIVFHYYCARGLTWEAILDVVAQKYRARMYHKAGIDAAAVEKLRRQVQGIEAVLSRY